MLKPLVRYAPTVFLCKFEGVRTEKILFTCVTFADGCFLAGRGLPGVVIAGSLLALFAAPRYLKSGITTIPQLLGERYDRPTKLWFSIAYIILYLFVQIPVILYSGSLVFENIFNLSGILGITKFQSIVILCILITIIGSIYAIFGGLKAVAVSDTINGVGLLIGGLMIPFLALNVLGHASGSESSVAIMDGVRYLIHNHADMLNSIAPAQSEAPAVPWPTVFLGLVFLGFMFLALPGVIAYAIFNIEGTQVSMMDDAYPALITRVVPQPVMGFFAAVMFGAILSSFNSVLNSVNTMFTMDIYKEFINKNASESKLVSVGKNIGIVFAIFSVIVGPMVYFFPAGLKTFLDSFVMLVGLPVLSGVFGGFFFNCLPKYSARFIMVFHIICYGGFMLLSPSYSLFGGNEGSIHYLYAVSILWPLEMLIMYLMHRRNKSKGAEVWVQQDVGAVDLTPWKYSKLVSVIVIVCVLLVYLAFSPLGIGA